jgi:hypothetical protein
MYEDGFALINSYPAFFSPELFTAAACRQVLRVNKRAKPNVIWDKRKNCF